MAFKGAIEVDTQKCKGCGVCVENCPTKSIELSKWSTAKVTIMPKWSARHASVVQTVQLSALIR